MKILLIIIVFFSITLIAVAEINIGDDWKDISEIWINIGDDWKQTGYGYINIGDDWKLFHEG